ncbi:MAG: hypothetical protein ACODAB_00575 [Gemmatimonadota bacterium]
MAGRLSLITALVLGIALLLCAGRPLPAQEPGMAAHALPALFQTSDRCIACHTDLNAPAGLDVSIGPDWRASMMANAARDPYWQAAVRREVMDHPEASDEIQNECSICHMPMARYTAVSAGGTGRVFEHLPIGTGDAPLDALAADGVSCTVCHQIRPDGLGEEESFVGGFVIDTAVPWGRREIFGPFAVDSGRTRVMRSASEFQPARAEHLKSSELCASCHTLYTHSRGADGEVIARLPEQMPYLEWRHSDFRDERSCQDCHMPVVEDSVAITGVLGQPRPDVSRHVFRGGNFFMLRMLGRYRAELGVTAQPAELELAAQRTIENLQRRTARLSVADLRLADGRLEADVVVENLAGHKLPTAYPSRRAWLHVTVRDGNGAAVFESGALDGGARIVGNDNDSDPERYEPHHATITRPDDVQIYEAVMVGPEDEVTTGLLTAVRYAKDNRILPRGFDPATASEDIAVQGRARDDRDFVGGEDRIRYVVAVDETDGPFTVEVELWYQPIAYRWARNLADYEAFETRRFLRYYESMSKGSAVKLAGSTATTR